MCHIDNNVNNNFTFCCIFAFDTTRGRNGPCPEFWDTPARSSVLSVEMTFNAPLSAEYDNAFDDRERSGAGDQSRRAFEHSDSVRSNYSRLDTHYKT